MCDSPTSLAYTNTLESGTAILIIIAFIMPQNDSARQENPHSRQRQARHGSVPRPGGRGRVVAFLGLVGAILGFAGEIAGAVFEAVGLKVLCRLDATRLNGKWKKLWR